MSLPQTEKLPPETIITEIVVRDAIVEADVPGSPKVPQDLGNESSLESPLETRPNAVLEVTKEDLDFGSDSGVHKLSEDPEERLGRTESEKNDDTTFRSDSVRAENESVREENESVSELSDPKPVSLKIRPQIRDVNYEQFKNRFSKDCQYAIEVLVVGPRFREEMYRELVKRSVSGKYKDEKLHDEMFPMSDDVDEKHGDEHWMQRVRIQSPAVLTALSQVTGQSWSTTPRTFFSPFRLLIHFHEKMKEKLNQLESKFGSMATLELNSADRTTQPEQDPAANTLSVKEESVSGSGDPGSLKNTPSSKFENSLGGEPLTEANGLLEDVDTLEQMRCYVKFVDERILPMARQFEKSDDSHPHPRKIRFDDLWYLLQPGEMVYHPNAAVNDRHGKQFVFRVFSLITPQPHQQMNPIEYPTPSSTEVHCYYVDYNGDSYGAVHQTFNIDYFSGYRDITSLVVYPLRFVPDSSRIIDELQKQGELFMEFLTEKHLSYTGWTLTSDPLGNKITDPRGKDIRHPEHVESDVIVDFEEAIQASPPWKPKFYSPGINEEAFSSMEDEIDIFRWSDQTQTKLESQFDEIVQIRDGMAMTVRNKFVKNDQFLGEKSGKPTFTPEDTTLLPTRLFAYILRERRFAHVHIRYLKKIASLDTMGFKRLRINENHRRIIESVVFSHFRKREMERKTGFQSIGQDLIRGKGGGLVILLHGVPGVGKTATAEAVSLANKKPLFVITCGDLGFTPDSVEPSLNEIFRLAHLWDCILLLDEADVFLSQREKTDLERNALVSGMNTPCCPSMQSNLTFQQYSYEFSSTTTVFSSLRRIESDHSTKHSNRECM
jgi:hypothetical protein